MNLRNIYNNTPVKRQGKEEYKTTIFLICFFFGYVGLHRYILGYKNWSIMVLSFGGLGVWQIMDLYNIYKGNLKFADGRPLKKIIK